MDESKSLGELREDLEKKLLIKLIDKTDKMEIHEATEVFRTLHQAKEEQ